MARAELVMPKMGESIMEATIIKWTKNTGDSIRLDETVLEIATDKVDSEVPSPVAGVLVEQRFKAGDVVPVGTVIAIVDTAAASASAQPTQPVLQQQPVQQMAQPVMQQTVAVAEAVSSAFTNAILAQPQQGRFYSPLVLNIAREEGIGMDVLDRIPGTGQDGRVTKKDILDYVATRKNGGATQQQAAVQQPTVQQQVAVQQPKLEQAQQAVAQTFAQEQPVTQQQGKQSGYAITVEGQSSQAANKKRSFSISGDVEIIEMDRMRKMIADNMVYSKHTSPHVTSFVEADVTNLVQWREKNKSAFEKKYGEKLTFTPIFIQAVARALRDFPMVNIAVDGDKIILRKDINVGMAVALPSGNLIVPVIKRADQLNLAGLTKNVNDLTARGRAGKLTMDDLEGGTYTLSNVGSFGNVMGTPIIMQPQCAILAVGAIKKKPAVLETPQGDVIAVRHMMFLSHSYDHRVIDGALGGSFVRRVADYLEAWEPSEAV